MSSNTVRQLISRTIEGVEALVTTESGEIFLDVPAETPRYIRVEEGATIQEGDIRSRTAKELESPTLRKWTVETIGRKTVEGTDRETGEEHEWDREELETKLAIGALSTNLVDFDRVNVTRGAATATPNAERPDEESATVDVTVYGNDGQKFSQTYRLLETDAAGEDRRVELEASDERVKTLETDLRERFDRAVEEALDDESYTL